jgi:hypothetical protein
MLGNYCIHSPNIFTKEPPIGNIDPVSQSMKGYSDVVYAHVVPMLTSDNSDVIVLSSRAEGVPQIVETTEWGLANTTNSAHDQSSGHVVLIDYKDGASSTAAPT